MRGFFEINLPWITIELTNKCNLNCIMCHVRQKDYLSPGDIEFELVKKIVDDIKKEKLKTGGVRLFWLGESTLHLRFKDIVEIFCDEKLRSEGLIPSIGFDTNGHGLTDENVEVLFKLSSVIPTHIIVSLDAVRKKTYERIRRGGNLSVVIDGVEKMMKKRLELNSLYPKISLQFIVMDENHEELPEFLGKFGNMFDRYGIGWKILINNSYASVDGFNLRPMTWQEPGESKQPYLNKLFVNTLNKCGIEVDETCLTDFTSNLN